MKKNKELPLEHLTDEQLDDFLQYSQPFTEENLKQIQIRFDQLKDAEPILSKPKKRKRWVVTLALAASVILLTAFTQISELKQLYYQIFGAGSEEIIDNSQQLSASIEDQGLRLKAVNSFKDGDTTYFLAELTDLTEDRLDEETFLNDWSMNGGGNAQIIDYDAKTKTATILVQAIASMDGENNNCFSLKSFKSGAIETEETLGFDLTPYLKTKATWVKENHENGFGGGYAEDLEEKYHMTLEELGENSLKAEEKTAQISQKQEISLSNVGYRDNLLHVQIKIPNTVKREYTFLSLVNKKNHKKVDSIASFQVDQGTHSNETYRTDYDEYVFDIPKEKLANYDLFVESRDYKTYQTGDWRIQMEEPQALPTKSFAAAEVTVENKKISLTDIVFSPISLSFETKQATDGDFKVALQLKDGTMIDYSKDASVTVASEKTTKVQITGDYLKLDQVEKILINDVELKEK